MWTHRDILDMAHDGPIPAADIDAAAAKDAAGAFAFPRPDENMPGNNQELVNAVRNGERLIKGQRHRLTSLARDRRFWRIATMNAATTEQRRWSRGRWDGVEQDMRLQLEFLKFYRARRKALLEHFGESVYNDRKATA